MANLGLPGFSGFVAEMNIFVGSFENPDLFHRTCTIIACTSIVITAVYILRVVGKILYQQVPDQAYYKLSDAAGLGMAPLWAQNIINDAMAPMLHHILSAGVVAGM